jgi:sugar lactone lactonase YvrE
MVGSSRDDRSDPHSGADTTDREVPMSGFTTRGTSRTRSTTLLLGATVGLVVAAVPPAAASPPHVIVLPGASSAEGIAKGEGDTFYAGDLFLGDIFRGDLEDRTAELFIDAPDGRGAVGMFADLEHDLLFVAGGFTGQAYVYDLDSGATVASYQFAMPPTVINDVTVTPDGAWFTDSLQATLFFVPVDRQGEPGEFRTLELHGPAADTSGEFNLNGIAATEDGGTLIVAHSASGALYTVDPDTGRSAEIAGVDVPAVDGIVLQDRELWAVQNELNQVSEVRLNSALTAGSIEEEITDRAFQTPTTAIRFGGRLAVVNAKFDTGFPPTADRYEVVLVDD